MKRFNAAKYKPGMKVVTGDNTTVRILCVDGEGEQPVVGMIADDVQQWHTTGVYAVNKFPSQVWDLYFADPLPPYEPSEEEIEDVLRSTYAQFAESFGENIQPFDWFRGDPFVRAVARYALIRIHEVQA